MLAEEPPPSVDAVAFQPKRSGRCSLPPFKTFENFFAIKENKMQPTVKSHGYKGLSYDRPALQAAMRKAYDSLIDFVTTDAFKTLMEDLGALHPIHRPKFVFDVC